MKKVLTIILSVLISYILFVTIDCIRIKNSEYQNIKPLITLNEKEDSSRIYYTGLGYSVVYYTDTIFKEGNDHKEVKIYGAEFRLFGKIIVWAYVS